MGTEGYEIGNDSVDNETRYSKQLNGMSKGKSSSTSNTLNKYTFDENKGLFTSGQIV